MIFLVVALHYALFFVLKFKITTFAFVSVVMKIIDPFNPLIILLLVFGYEGVLLRQIAAERSYGVRLLWLLLFTAVAGALNLLVVNPFLFDQPIVWAEWWRPVFNGAVPMLVGGSILVAATKRPEPRTAKPRTAQPRSASR